MMARLNFFAHAREVLDQPDELAGTALPDWIGATKRRVWLDPALVDAGTPLGAGIERHWRDDARFHTAPAFLEVARSVTLDLRRLHPDRPQMRASFFGHVLVEVLLDDELARKIPDGLDRYYASLDRVDLAAVARAVAPWLTQPLPGLLSTMERFRASRFLYGYRETPDLLARLERTAARVRLRLPDGMDEVVARARPLVRQRCAELLA